MELNITPNSVNSNQVIGIIKNYRLQNKMRIIWFKKKKKVDTFETFKN